MSIQYSGNAQTSTFTPSVKQDIINNVGAALLAAGWTTVSGGSGTTAWLLKSVTTPQGFAICVLMQDNGGTCVTFSLQSTDGVLIGGNSTTVGGAFLQPGSGSYVYRVICNSYQAFVYVTPDPGVSRTFAAFGVPYVPSWVASGTTRIGWMMGNAYEDTDATVRYSFRTALQGINNNGGISCGQQAMYNASLWNNGAGGSYSSGLIALPTYTIVLQGSVAASGYRWENGSALLYDATVGWADTGPSGSQENKFKGQLWDAVISTDAYAGDDTATFDGHNWICVTDNNAGTSTQPRGTLLIAIS